MSGGLTCEIKSSFDGLDSWSEEWDKAVVELGGPIYMTYHWLKTWWSFYGRGTALRLYVFRRDGRIVALIPIYLDTIGLAPLGLRVARIVGASLPPKIFDPPVAEECAAEVWRKVIQELFGKDGCDILSFGPVAESYPAARGIGEACQAESSLVDPAEFRQKEVQTIYHLPATYEAYFESLDSKERKTRRKKLRELEAVAPVRSEVIDDPALVKAEFEAFNEQHTTQWQSEGRPGHFHAWPNALEYNRALVNALGPLRRVRFYKVYSGEQVITRQYTYVLGNRLYAELPARAFGDPWDRFSLGCTSQIKLLEAAIQGGIQRMDSGLGHYEYKILTGGVETPVNVVYIRRSGGWSGFKFKAWGKFHEFLRLFLHKIWYRKVMPHLPKMFRSGQSELLLRLDF
jgi:CelD/BcsL family acetyltransferase involved in cellulose biosynthesis